MPPEIRNILADLPPALSGEVFETIATSDTLCIERIVSCGQSTPAGEWYEQDRNEWVLVLAGSADLLFDDAQEPRRLIAGDYALIPAGCRHRVTWTDPAAKTVWLAVHFTSDRTP
ncbi:MAG: cupin domain-containing protein [Verrucomicrobia bacterium]|nr:cupin domain-containing protein [Deltaproteobacteria bacterium]